LQCAVDQTRHTLKTDAAWLYLLSDRNQLELQAHNGLSTDYVRGMQGVKLGVGIEGRVALNNKSQFVESVADDVQGHKIWVDKEKLQALAAVPITRPGVEAGQTQANVIGVLATGKRANAYMWTPREVRLLTSIANQVAPAIDNAHLYSKVQEGEVGLRVGNEVLQEINDMLLEKNANLEGFIQNDLSPALTIAAQALKRLSDQELALTEAQKQELATLEKIVNRVNELAHETTIISATFDSEFSRVLDTEDKKQNYSSLVKPVRLEKVQDASAKSALVEPVLPKSTAVEKAKPVAPPASEKVKNSDNAPTRPLKNVDNSKAMSFEDAVAAGLVPGHILNREKKE